MMCRWLLTLSCIDRCCLLSSDARIRSFSTLRLAKRLVLALFLFWILFPTHLIIFLRVRVEGFVSCMFTTTAAAFYHNIYALIIGGLLPALITIIATKSIWTNLRLKRERRDLLNQNSTNDNRDRQILLMLIVQVLVYLLCNLPFMTNNLYLTSTRSVENKSDQRLAIENFAQFLSELFIMIFPASTFYTNTIVSRTFRSDLCHLLRSMFGCHSSEPSNEQEMVRRSTKQTDLPLLETK